MLWPYVLTLYVVASTVTFIAYAIDKSQAMRGGRRVRERTLHVLEFVGGWPGALLAQAVIRHKRRKGEYMLIFTAIVAAHLIAWATWFKLR
jgi:uncharacterized membrane protein YsdA (DUF1294 family)